MIIYNWTKNNFDELDIYCFICGTATLSQNGIQKCSHLVLIGTSDVIEYDKNDLMKTYDDEEHGFIIDYLKKELSDDYLMLWRNNPAPSFFDEYFVYTF